MIVLYGKAASRASRNLWALEELGVPYRHVPHDYRTGDTNNPDYLAINPAGKIPSLADGDVVMTESLAMNLYLAQTYGKDSLWPTTAKAQAKCLQWTLWAATELEPPAVGRLIEFVYKAEADRDQKHIAALADRTKPALDVLAAGLKKSPYLTGSDFTIADLNVAAVVEYLLRSAFDLSRWPAVDVWAKACFARSANQKVTAMKVAA